MTIVELVERIRGNPKCRVTAQNPAQTLDASLVLPEDLKEFYNLCGGADLFLDEDYGFRIVSPSEFKPATPDIHRILYAAPNLIFHYVRDHAYKPPQEFIDAVLTGPAPDSAAYQDQLRALDLLK